MGDSLTAWGGGFALRSGPRELIRYDRISTPVSFMTLRARRELFRKLIGICEMRSFSKKRLRLILLERAGVCRNRMGK